MFGYTVQVDGVTIPMDMSWTDANKLGEFIGALRFTGDARGFAGCKHRECSTSTEYCLRVRGPHNPDGMPSSREGVCFHFDNRHEQTWHVYTDEDHDPGDAEKTNG